MVWWVRADAAVTAVREWRYTQTLLNCTPIEVQMTVTTRFRAQKIKVATGVSAQTVGTATKMK